MSPSDPCPSPFRAPIGATGGLGHGSRLSPRRGWKRLLLTCLRVLGLTNKLHIGRKPLWLRGLLARDTSPLAPWACGLYAICTDAPGYELSLLRSLRNCPARPGPNVRNTKENRSSLVMVRLHRPCSGKTHPLQTRMCHQGKTHFLRR